MPDGDVRGAVAERSGRLAAPGRVSTPTASRRARTAAPSGCTIGQRAGLGVATGERQYVAASTPRQPRPAGPPRGPGPTEPGHRGMRSSPARPAARSRPGSASATGRLLPGRVRPLGDAGGRPLARRPRADAWAPAPGPGRGAATAMTTRSSAADASRRRTSRQAGYPPPRSSRRKPGPRHQRRPEGRRGRAGDERGPGRPSPAPALVLSVLIGSLHTCLYVLVRGRLGWHVLLVLPAAIVGAWAGQALGARSATRCAWATTGCCGLGLRVVVSASIVASALVVADPEPPDPGGQVRPLQA